MLIVGALAQLGAHHTGSVGVTGSSPVCSTREPRVARISVAMRRKVCKYHTGFCRIIQSNHTKKPLTKERLFS